MNVAIIEDESYTAEYLKELLTALAPDVEIPVMLSGVNEAIAYFSSHSFPDLIFCDIHLADGSSFEIFHKVKIKAPVIFVTAYDQYALQAFKANGIDYILKPFNENAILESLNKFRLMYGSRMQQWLNYERVIKDIEEKKKIKDPSSLLIKFGEKIRPVKIAGIAFFITENKGVYLVTLKNEKFSYNKPLEEIEKLCGDLFYRVNRQVLINRNAIDEVSQTHTRKLLVQLKTINAPVFEINKAKMSHFLTWLSG
ncbi:MAG: LytTR family DNA-binding domain-containing protein [Niabella sp.]